MRCMHPVEFKSSPGASLSRTKVDLGAPEMAKSPKVEFNASECIKSVFFELMYVY